MVNKYKEIYTPSHPRCHASGCVFEHILVAEKIMGRYLVEGETVHHKDRDKSNNSEENLIVFRTNADHSRFHMTGILEENEDGTYSSPYQHRCVVCDKKISYKATKVSHMCSKCYYESKQGCSKVNKLPTKEDLEALLRKRTSFLEIGKLYGVSDNAMRRWYKKFGLPYRLNDIKEFLKLQRTDRAIHSMALGMCTIEILK